MSSIRLILIMFHFNQVQPLIKSKPTFHLIAFLGLNPKILQTISVVKSNRIIHLALNQALLLQQSTTSQNT